MGKTGIGLRRLGKPDMLELMRVVPMCAADWLQESLGHALPAAALAAPAAIGSSLGPWSAGTAASLLLYESVRGAEVKGGPAALTQSLQKAFEAAGGEIALESRVARIRLEHGAVCGVEIEGGDFIEAPLVVASCDPKRALLDQVEPGTQPLDV
jgi:phytoene dehydrogenase-like protein